MGAELSAGAPPGDEARGLRWLDAVLLFVLALAVRVPLLLGAATLHGGDALARLARSDQILLGYQLPLTQALVFLARAADPDPRLACLVFVAIGALVPVALAAAVARTAGAPAGRAAGALLAGHALFVHYSLVPYQEGLMVLLLLLGVLALMRGREALASVAIGLACLTRYEAWLAAALFVIARRQRPWRSLLLFGWAPLLWLLAWRGLSPAGTYVLDLDPAAGRLARLPFLLGKLREYSDDLLLVLALAGAALALRRREPRWGWPAAYVGLFLASILVAGHEFPPGSGHVSERLDHVPAAAACALAGLALGRLAQARPRLAGPALAAVLVAAVMVPGVRHARALMSEAGRDPSLRLAAELAAFAEGHLPPDGKLAVAAPAVSAADLESFVRKVEASGGDVERARALARDLTRHEPDVDRIAAHLARPPGTVVPAGTAPAALVAVYDDAPAAEAWRRGAPQCRLVAGPRALTVYLPGP